MVISDVDGTLVYKGSAFNAPRFPALLNKLQNCGAFFGVATGRCRTELVPLIGSHFSSIDAVCCDGACLYEKGRLIYGSPIGTETLAEATEPLFARGIPFELHAAEKTYLFGAPFVLTSKETRRLSDVAAANDLHAVCEPIYKLAVYSDRKEFLPRVSSLRLSYSAPDIREYVNAAATKYSAVCFLLNRNGLSLSDLIYFGDGDNDAELLKNCGRAFTPYCASAHIFPLAREHTRDVIGTVIRLCDEKNFDFPS